MIEVDARGMSCPEPIMRTSDAMRKHPEESLKVLVSETYSKINVEKFAKSQGKKVTVKEIGLEFELIIESL